MKDQLKCTEPCPVHICAEMTKDGMCGYDFSNLTNGKRDPIADASFMKIVRIKLVTIRGVTGVVVFEIPCLLDEDAPPDYPYFIPDGGSAVAVGSSSAWGAMAARNLAAAYSPASEQP